MTDDVTLGLLATVGVAFLAVVLVELHAVWHGIVRDWARIRADYQAGWRPLGWLRWFLPFTPGLEPSVKRRADYSEAMPGAETGTADPYLEALRQGFTITAPDVPLSDIVDALKTAQVLVSAAPGPLSFRELERRYAVAFTEALLEQGWQIVRREDSA